MSNRWTVTCSACKFYNIPLYCIETSNYHNKTCQLKKPYPCLCLKANEKGKNDVDSLKGLRNNSNCNDLDDKIKNLKSELTSLVKEDSKSEVQNNINNNNINNNTNTNTNTNTSTNVNANASSNNNNNNNNNLNAKNIRTSSVIKHVHKSHDGNVSFSEGRIDLNLHHPMPKETKPDSDSKKKDFTNWLDSTIDSLSKTPNSDGNKSKQIPARKNKTLDTLGDGNAECLIETDYLTEDWDDLQIAQELLYESFFMQNYPCYMSPVDDEVEALPINLTKRKHERKEGRNSSAKKIRTYDKTQNSDSKKQGDDKMMSRANQNRSDSEVEVINIDDDDSNNSSSEINEVVRDEDTQKVILIEDNDTNPETEATEKENSDSKKRIWECPICFEQNTGQEVVTTMCGHVFCKKCLEDYYTTYEKSCPTCRTNLQDKPLITLFNF